MDNEQASKQSGTELLLLSEVAQLCRVPLSSVRHWIQTGKLRSGRFARRRLVRRDELQRFIDAGFSSVEDAVGEDSQA